MANYVVVLFHHRQRVIEYEDDPMMVDIHHEKQLVSRNSRTNNLYCIQMELVDLKQLSY